MPKNFVNANVAVSRSLPLTEKQNWHFKGALLYCTFYTYMYLKCHLLSSVTQHYRITHISEITPTHSYFK